MQKALRGAELFAWQRWLRDSAQVAVVYGHGVGDVVLQHVAQVLKSALRETDFVARFGGEEFIVLLPATDLANACRVGEKIRQNIETSPAEQVGRVTVSIGLAIAAATQSDEDDVVQQADQWLYKAKLSGRNQLAWAVAVA